MPQDRNLPPLGQAYDRTFLPRPPGILQKDTWVCEQKHKQGREQEPTQNQSTATLTPTERDTKTTSSASEVKEQTNQKQKQKQKEHQKHKATTKTKASLAGHAAPVPTQQNTTTQTTMAAPASNSAFKVTQATIFEIGELYKCACSGEARRHCLWTHVEMEDKRSEIEIDVVGGTNAKTWEKDRWTWDEEFDPKNQRKKSGKKEVKKLVKR